MLRFDGIYFCSNGSSRLVRSGISNTTVLSDSVLQFYSLGQVRFGLVPHHYNSNELREFIVKKAEKTMAGLDEYRKAEYFFLEWFFDVIRHLDPNRHPVYLKSSFIEGTYYIEENQLRIITQYFEGNNRKIIKHNGFIKKDCMDLQGKYPTSDSSVDELYEFVAFHYK